MKLRHPPGRGGRLWLQHRIAIASSGADLLDKKRRALRQELRRVRALARQTEVAWTSAAADAEMWVTRAGVIAGETNLRTLALTGGRAAVTVHWKSSMGVLYAAEAHVERESPPAATVSGGSAATDVALPAAGRAVAAAVENAAAQSALTRIGHELAITSRRHRALERRWLPALAGAAARLDDRLDELEREEATRSAWAARRRGGP